MIQKEESLDRKIENIEKKEVEFEYYHYHFNIDFPRGAVRDVISDREQLY